MCVIGPKHFWLSRKNTHDWFEFFSKQFWWGEKNQYDIWIGLCGTISLIKYIASIEVFESFSKKMRKLIKHFYVYLFAWLPCIDGRCVNVRCGWWYVFLLLLVAVNVCAQTVNVWQHGIDFFFHWILLQKRSTENGTTFSIFFSSSQRFQF